MFYQSFMGWINYYIKQYTVSLIIHKSCPISIHFQTLSWCHTSYWVITFWHSHLFTAISSTCTVLLCTFRKTVSCVCDLVDQVFSHTGNFIPSSNFQLFLLLLCAIVSEENILHLCQKETVSFLCKLFPFKISSHTWLLRPVMILHLCWITWKCCGLMHSTSIQTFSCYAVFS